MSSPYLFFNTIDNRWKVLDSKGYCLGDGNTKAMAVASARIVTDETIVDEFSEVYSE